MEKIAIYILAGGKSSRMGTDKGLMLFGGKPMIQHVLDTVSILTSTISIVSSNKNYQTFGYPVIQDLIVDKGPVGGIYTALSDSSAKLNIILSCDTPFVSLRLIQKLIDTSVDVDICIPSFKGKIHPLIGVYKKKSTATFKICLDSNVLKLMTVNQKLNTVIIEVEKEFKEKEFLNINTKNELFMFS